jgi:ankyrin repeat protein
MPDSAKPTGEKASRSGDVFEDENQLWSEAFWAWNVVLCHDPGGYSIQNAASHKMTDVEKVVDVRNTLRQLSKWPGAASQHALSVATTIESVMNILSSDFPGKPYSDELTWSMVATTRTDSDAAEKRNANSQIRFLLTRKDGAWKADQYVIEAVLSLWLYSIRHNQSQKPKGSDGSGKSSTQTEEEGQLITNKNVKLLGRNVTALRRDLRWYLSDKVSSVVVVHEAAKSAFVAATNIEGTRVLGSGVMTAISAKNLKSRRSKTDNGLKWESFDDEEPGPETSLAVFSEHELVQASAQDMFSTFMWAVAKFTNRIEGDVTVHQHNAQTKHDVIAPFRLENAKLQKIAQAFYKSGLGSEEAYHAIIPQLTKENKLPVPRELIEHARTIAQVREDRSHWKEAAEVYMWLFQVGQTFEPNDPFSAKATAMLFEFYETVSSIAEHWKAQSRELKDIEPITRLMDVVSKKLESAKKPESGLTIMETLSKMYRIQGRDSHAAKADMIDGKQSDDTRSMSSNQGYASYTLLHSAIQGDITEGDFAMYEEFVNCEDILGWTPLHYAVVADEEENVQALLKQGSKPANTNAKDLSGWAPLHHAAHRGLKDIAVILINEGADLDLQGRLGVRPLHCAVRGKKLYMVQWLFEAGADIDAQDHFRSTPLHLAAHCGLKDISVLLQNGGARRMTRDDYGRTVLSTAAVQGRSEVVEALMDKDVDNINSRDRLGRTALYLAACNGHTGVVQRLLDDPKCDVDSKDAGYHTALFLAVYSGQANVVEKLVLSDRCNVNKKNSVGDTALGWAVRAGRAAIVEQLLLAGALVGSPNSIYTSLLSIAAWRGRFAMAMMLIAKGADVNGGFDRSPLACAAYRRHHDVVSLLLANKAHPNPGTSYLETPVIAAIYARCANSMRLLLDAGAVVDERFQGMDKSVLGLALEIRDPEISRLLIAKGARLEASNDESALYSVVDNADDSLVQALLDRNCPGAVNEHGGANGRTLLCRAAERGRVSVVDVLLNSGALHSATDSSGRTPLMFAARNGSEDIVERLIGLGADVNAADDSKRTALYYTVNSNDDDVVQILLTHSHGPDLNEQRGDNGITLLCRAAERGRISLVNMLIDNGALHGATDSEGQTPLMCAAQSGNKEIAERLIGLGSDVNAADNFRRTALTIAVKGGKDDVVEVLLLQPHINIDCVGNGGRTALLEAVESDSRYVVELLLAKNANISIGDEDGKTPETVATEKGFDEILELLQNHEKR